MKVTLDENGIALPDVKMNEHISAKLLTGEDIHTSQLSLITCLRARLVQMPVEDRPKIEWEFYGKTVHFDYDLRSLDAWSDPRTNIEEDALHAIISARPYHGPKAAT